MYTYIYKHIYTCIHRVANPSASSPAPTAAPKLVKPTAPPQKTLLSNPLTSISLTLSTSSGSSQPKPGTNAPGTKLPGKPSPSTASKATASPSANVTPTSQQSVVKPHSPVLPLPETKKPLPFLPPLPALPVISKKVQQDMSGEDDYSAASDDDGRDADKKDVWKEAPKAHAKCVCVCVCVY